MKKLFFPVLLSAFLVSTFTFAEKVKFILLGDTQHILNTSYDPKYYTHYITAMDRIKTDPVTSDALAFLHMGDMIETGRDNNIPLSYDRLKEGLDKLHIPWVPAYGNNDNSGEFNSTFPISQLSQSPYFLENKNDSRNLAYHFQAGGVDWLVISYQYNGSELNWAKGLVEQHFDKNVIIIKHDLNDSIGNSFTQQFLGYENVKLLLCGHTASVITEFNGHNGNKIGFIKHNWHSKDKDTYMAIVELDTVAGTIEGRHYSTYYQKFYDDPSAPYHASAPTWAPWTWSGYEFVGAQVPNASQFVSQAVPDTIMPGETVSVTVTMKNSGVDTWSAANGHRLGSRPGGDNTWGMTRVSLPGNVQPGEEVDITFDITAPTTIGTYDFEWQMVDDIQPNQSWFGATTPKVSIEVNWPIVNSLQNPSFEAGGSTPNNWNVSGSYTRTNEESLFGDYALKAVGTGGSLGNASQTVSLTPNTNYEISVRIYYTAGSLGNFIFDTSDKFDASGQGQFVVGGPTGGWQTFKGAFNSGVETSITVRTFSTAFTGTAYVDNVVLGNPSNRQPPNLAPEFDNTPATYVEVGSVYNFSATATDPDGDSVTLSQVNLPTWLSFNSGSGQLSGTPAVSDIGGNSVTLRASDGALDNDLEFTIHVNAAGNDIPEITSTAVEVAIDGQAYSYTVTAFDADGDSLILSAPTKPNWLSFDAGSGVLSGTPSTPDIGVEEIVINVNDGSINAEQRFNLVVFQSPTAANIVTNGSFESGGANPTTWSLGNSATGSTERAQDVGSSSLKLTGGSSPTTQTITLEPNTDYNISVWIDASSMTTGNAVFDTGDVFDGAGQGQFVVYNANGGWTQYNGSFNSGAVTSITLRMFGSGMVGDVYFDNVVVAQPGGGNLAPAFSSTAVTEATEGELYSYQVKAVDAEGDVLTFNGANIPAWLTFDNGTGLINGTPNVSHVGDHLTTVEVSDGESTTEQEFFITVSAMPNGAPSWSGSNFTMPNANAASAFNYDTSSHASDPDGDSLSFSILSSTANWLTISNSGTLSGTPGGSDVGFGTVTVGVSDGINPVVPAVFSITVGGALIDLDADDDKDGVINRLELALGGDPNVPDSGTILPQVLKNGSNIDISFHRGEAAITYTIEKSSDLATWTDHVTVSDIHGLVGGSCTVSVPDSEMSNGKLFLRLKVED